MSMGRPQPGMLLSVVLMLTLAFPASPVSPSHDAIPTKLCAHLCRCLDKGSVITCRQSQLTAVPSLLSTAIVLDLDHNRINIIHNNSFVTAARLEIISLEHNGIIHIEGGAFATLVQLRILRLGNNHLSHLPSNVFISNENLEVLDLHGNAFVEIPDNVMSPLKSLQMLNLTYNHLTTPMLGPGFQNTKQLSMIDLTGNNFLTLDAHVFQATLWWNEQRMTYLNLSYCNIRRIHANALSQLYRLRTLTLEGNNEVSHVDLELALHDLEVSSLVELNLSHMNITDVYVFFSRFQHRNLLHLDLSYNSITEIPKRTFYFLVNLRYLDLRHNVLDSVGDLSGLTRLEYLDLSYNRITEIEHTSFEGLQLLRSLDLSHNLLRSIEDEPFQKLWDLQTLDISCNKITSFVINSGLENLEILKASSNRIVTITAVRRLMRLKHLDLSKNHIQRLESPVFSRSHSLEHVNFSHNVIGKIERNAFDASAQEELDLSHNRITKLVNYGWRRIRSLNLHGNLISNMSVNAFRGLNSLISLDIGGNNFKTLNAQTFTDVYNLRDLTLSYNQLGRFLLHPLSFAIFNSLWKLESLDISRTGLERLAPQIVSNLTLLQSLNVSGNRLEIVDRAVLKKLPRLEVFDISDNQLTLPDPTVFIQSSRLRKLDVSLNPYECTCELMPFRNWLLAANITILGLKQPKTYLCLGPPEWKGIPLSDFHLESNTCSHHEKAVVFASIGCTVLGAALLLLFGVYRYKWANRHKLNRTHYSVIDEAPSVQINPQNRDWV